MKKAKIMLLAITVLAIVGGALAFKARTFNAVALCTTDLDPVKGCNFEPGFCNRAANFSATSDPVNPAFCYTTTDIELACGTDCTNPATISFPE